MNPRIEGLTKEISEVVGQIYILQEKRKELKREKTDLVNKEVFDFLFQALDGVVALARNNKSLYHFRLTNEMIDFESESAQPSLYFQLNQLKDLKMESGVLTFQGECGEEYSFTLLTNKVFEK